HAQTPLRYPPHGHGIQRDSVFDQELVPSRRLRNRQIECPPVRAGLVERAKNGRDDIAYVHKIAEAIACCTEIAQTMRQEKARDANGPLFTARSKHAARAEYDG